MFRPAIRNGARALKVRSFSTAALTQVRSGRQTVRAAAAGSALLISASFATACDSVTKYIQTTSGLKYRNIVLGKGATAISGETSYCVLSLTTAGHPNPQISSCISPYLTVS